MFIFFLVCSLPHCIWLRAIACKSPSTDTFSGRTYSLCKYARRWSFYATAQVPQNLWRKSGMINGIREMLKPATSCGQSACAPNFSRDAAVFGSLKQPTVTAHSKIQVSSCARRMADTLNVRKEYGADSPQSHTQHNKQLPNQLPHDSTDA